MNTVYYIETNLLCISVLTVLLFNTARLQSRSKKSQYYINIAVLSIILCFSDMITWIVNGGHFDGANVLSWFSNAAYLCTLPLISYFWTLYSEQIYREKNAAKHLSLLIPLCVICVLILSAPLNGWMFSIDSDNIYHRGPLLWTQWVYACVCLAIPTFYAFRFRKRVKQWGTIVLFSIAPIICSILQVLHYGITTIQAGITFSTLLLYVMLQSDEVIASHAKAQLMAQISQTDALTGIRNRRSYELTLCEANRCGTVGAIFCDVNGLKYTNDAFGHKAGDQLLINFVHLLKESFPAESLYRISGDEFVVLLPAADEEAFNVRASNFAAKIAANARIAAVGWYTGNAADTLAVVSAAEKEMYRDKQDYYVKSGRDRRH